MKKYLPLIIAGLLFTAMPVSAAAPISLPVNGGTGTSTPPKYGQVLVGNFSGGYTLTSTSSLGIANAAISVFPFMPTLNFGALANSTSTPIWFQNGLQASSTSQFVNANFSGILNAVGNTALVNATSTNFAITSISGQLLKTLSSGAIVAAIAGTDYLTSANITPFPFTPGTFGATLSNSTSTLIGLNAGLYSLASSTIGNGAQNGGLTISGGATTTGSIILPTLANAAGSFLAIDPKGRIIATTSPVVLPTLGAGTVNSTAAGTLYNTATSTITPGIGISYTGIMGSEIGGVSGTLSVATSSLFSGTTGQVGYFNGSNSITGTSSLFIAGNQAVGIGTTAPAPVTAGRNALQLGDTGSTLGSEFRIVTSGIQGRLFNNNSQFGFGTDNAADISIFTNGGANPKIYLSGAGTQLAFSTTTTDALYSTTKYLFQVNTSDTQPNLFTVASSTSLGGGLNYTLFTIKNNGNVGIGTTTPSQRLDLGGGNLKSGSLIIAGTPQPFANPIILGSETPSSFVYLDNTYGQLRIGNQGATSVSGISFEVPNGTGYQDIMGIATSSGVGPSAAFDNMLDLGSTTDRWRSLRVGTGNGIFDGRVGVGSTSPSGKVVILTGASSTPNLILDDTSGGGCIINKDAAGGTYTEIYTQAGVLLSKVATSMTTCN